MTLRKRAALNCRLLAALVLLVAANELDNAHDIWYSRARVYREAIRKALDRDGVTA